MLKYEYISLSIHTTMFRKIYCRYRKTTFMRKIENMEENSHGNTFAVDSLSNHKPNRKVLPQHQMSEFNDCLCSFTINAETKFLLHKVGNIRPFCIASTIIIIPLTNCYLQEPLWIQPYFEQKAEKYFLLLFFRFGEPLPVLVTNPNAKWFASHTNALFMRNNRYDGDRKNLLCS